MASNRGRSIIGRATSGVAALVLAGGLLAVAPSATVASSTGCDTVTATSPAPLQVHVTVAGCGDSSGPFMASVTLAERRSGRIVHGWSTAPAAGPLTIADETIAVPASGWYDLQVNNQPLLGAQNYQTAEVLVADGGKITITAPYAGFRIGTLSANWGATLRWARIGTASVLKYQVQRSLDGAAFAYLAATKLPSLATTVRAGHRYQYRVRAVATSGVAGPWRLSDVLAPRGAQENTAGFVFGGSWATSTSSLYWGGHTKTASVAGRTATLTFSGEGIAIVASTGHTRGSFRVYVDGVYRTTVSTYRATTAHRQIVYSVWWSGWGNHTIQLKVVGTSGHPRVDLDGVMILDTTR
jgi:hypothetical protein